MMIEIIETPKKEDLKAVRKFLESWVESGYIKDYWVVSDLTRRLRNETPKKKG